MIQFLTIESLFPTEKYHSMQDVYGDDYVDMNVVHHWAEKCQDGKPGRFFMIKDKIGDL